MGSFRQLTTSATHSGSVVEVGECLRISGDRNCLLERESHLPVNAEKKSSLLAMIL